MKKSRVLSLIKLIMYGLVGFATASANVTIVTWEFWVIMLALVVVDVLSTIIVYEKLHEG